MQNQDPEIMYMLQDLTRSKSKNGKPYFSSVLGDCVEVISKHGKAILVKNRDGETSAISTELLSYTPTPNPPGKKPERVETLVAKQLDRPIYIPSKLTSPIARPTSKVKHLWQPVSRPLRHLISLASPAARG